MRQAKLDLDVRVLRALVSAGELVEHVVLRERVVQAGESNLAFSVALEDLQRRMLVVRQVKPKPGEDMWSSWYAPTPKGIASLEVEGAVAPACGHEECTPMGCSWEWD